MGIYIPLSQYTPNLYTNGGEYIVEETGKDYRGPYWSYISGDKFVGSNPNSTPRPMKIIAPITDLPTGVGVNEYSNTFSQVALSAESADDDFGLLQEFIDDGTVAHYNNIKSKPLSGLSFNPEIKTIPSKLSPKPSQGDYDKGFFTRFFVKKRNELRYYETSKEYYNPMRYEKNDYYWELYQVFPLSWALVGNYDRVKVNNINNIILTERKYNLPNFHLFFTPIQYNEYYIGSNNDISISSNPNTTPLTFPTLPPLEPIIITPSFGGLGY